MKAILIFLLLLLVFKPSIALHVDSTRTELLILLKERKAVFDQYSSSINKKSGLFGNRTKNDLKDSQEKLVSIVAADNKIMNSLSRTLDFRNFEKLNLSYDVNSYEDRIRNLLTLNDTLNNQNNIYKKENKILNSTIKKHHLYFAMLILLLILSGIVLFKKFLSR